MASETLIQITRRAENEPFGSPSGVRPSVEIAGDLTHRQTNLAGRKEPNAPPPGPVAPPAARKEAPRGLSASAVFTALRHGSVKDLVMQGGSREDSSAVVPSP